MLSSASRETLTNTCKDTRSRMWIIQNMEKSCSQAFVNAMHDMFSPSDLQKSLCFVLYCDFTASEIWIFQKKFQVDDGTMPLQKAGEMLELSHCIDQKTHSTKTNFQVKILLGWWENRPSKWYHLEDFTYHPAENSLLQVETHFHQKIRLWFFWTFFWWCPRMSANNLTHLFGHCVWSHNSTQHWRRFWSNFG